MSKPIFAIEAHGRFLNPGGRPAATEGLFGKKSVFGPVKRLYVHGKLEQTICYDICALVAGDFVDAPRQEAAIMDSKGTLHDAVIVMVTSDTGNKYAFLVEPTPEEEKMAHDWLWNGEWLQDGKDRTLYSDSTVVE